MASSKLPEITSALVTLFEAASGLDGVKVAHVERPDTKSDWILVGGGKATRQFKSLGNQPTPLDEDFSIECEATAIKVGGTTYTDAQARAFQLLDAAESALRDDHRLSDLVRWATVATVQEHFEPVDKGRAATVRFTVTGKTRI